MTTNSIEYSRAYREKRKKILEGKAKTYDYIRKTKKVLSPQETMLRDFLNAKTPQAKREIIATFAPHYFIFGERLDPRNPYEERGDEL